MADILVVDDDQSVATAFQHFLSFVGHACRLTSNAEDAMREVEARVPDLVMMDVRMPGVDGLHALEQLRQRFPRLQVVIMTAYGTSQTSIDAIRAGAFDYLIKPLDLDHLQAVIDKALDAQRTADDGVTEPQPPEPAATLIGDVPAMQDVYKMIGRLTTNSVPSLIVGEPGTGKHLVVSTIHNNSARRDQPLTILDCATISDAEFSAQLFHDGGGTLDLRDVDQLSPPMQARVAQALAAQRTRGGGSRLTVRMVATAGSDLSDAAASGTFSRSLYDELAVITIRMPPLRDRHQDIPLLVRYFIQRFNAELSRSVRGVDDQVASALAEYPWPGNVAQLERVIKRACIVTRSQIITMDDLGDTLGEVRMSGSPDSHGSLARALRTVLHDRLVQKGGSESVYHDIVDRVETALVEEALTITNGNQVKAAEILGVNRATLKKKMPSG